jgi:hypothetical protein
MFELRIVWISKAEKLKIEIPLWKMSGRNLKFEMSKYWELKIKIYINIKNWKLKTEMSKYWKLKMSKYYWKLKF